MNWPRVECAEWLGEHARRPEAEPRLKSPRQCGRRSPTAGGLLARASPWSREKLPFDAPQVEPPDDGRDRVEPSDAEPCLGSASLGGTGRAGTRRSTGPPRWRAWQRAAYGRIGRTYRDVRTLPLLNLRTMPRSPTTDRRSRPACGHMRRVGRSPRSSPGWGEPTTRRRGAVRQVRPIGELSPSEDV
jgi:hypothetical protein